MSLNVGPRNVASNALNRLAPECQKTNQSLKTSATIIVIMIVVVLILLVTAILYSYYKKVDGELDNDAMNDKKKKVVSGLTITSAVLLFLTSFVAVYQLSALSRSLRVCFDV